MLTSIYADIGGGSVVNGTRNSLARIPLRWMIRQCFLAKTGIMFHKDTFPKIGLDPGTIFPEVLLPRPPMVLQDPKIHTIPVPKPLVVDDDRKAVVYTDGGSFVNEAEEDLADALSPMYDELVRAKYWWILEMIPQRIRYQSSETNKTVRELTYVDLHFDSLCVKMDVHCCPPLIRVNMGRPRHVAMQKKSGIKIHRSVKLRMEALGLDGMKEGEKYSPKVEIRVTPTWVD